MRREQTMGSLQVLSGSFEIATDHYCHHRFVTAYAADYLHGKYGFGNDYQKLFNTETAEAAEKVLYFLSLPCVLGKLSLHLILPAVSQETVKKKVFFIKAVSLLFMSTP